MKRPEVEVAPLDVITRLHVGSEGNSGARAKLRPLPHQKLPCCVAAYLRRERRDNASHSTALLHEASFRRGWLSAAAKAQSPR
jgi:hypothetical protein